MKCNYADDIKKFFNQIEMQLSVKIYINNHPDIAIRYFFALYKIPQKEFQTKQDIEDIRYYTCFKEGNMLWLK